MMKVLRVRKSLQTVPVTLFVATIFALFLLAGLQANNDTNRHSPRLRNALLRKLLERNHMLVPAFSSAFRVRPPYSGRWVSTLNQLRRDVSFPGSYVEFDVCNTTALYVALRNLATNSDAADEPANIDVRQISIQTAANDGAPSFPVSLLVQIDDHDAYYFNRTGHGTLSISSKLEQDRCYLVRLTHLAPSFGTASTLEFEGIWLDKTGWISAQDDRPMIDPQKPSDIDMTPVSRHFEVIMLSLVGDPQDAINSWPSQLARQSNTSHSVFPAQGYCLTSPCSFTMPLLSDVSFRGGPPGTPHYQRPQQFGLPYPSALIFNVGLLDYQSFLRMNPSPHAINAFTTDFVQHLTRFVLLVRSTAYPYQSMYVNEQSGTVNIDASFIYNSAPSTLRIFLLTPVTPDKRTHRLLSHAMSETVSNLQSQGDKSSFWIDTSGWLIKDDFITRGSVTKPEDSASEAGFKLTPKAHDKIASNLFAHLCPYLSSQPSSIMTSPHMTTFPSLKDITENTGCPFNKHDNYLGHLYVPAEAGMGKMMEERKIELVKKFLGMEGSFS